MIDPKRLSLRVASGLALVLAPACPALAAGGAHQVELSAPLLICHELAGGVRPPAAPGSAAEHDLVFFLVAGRNADGTEIREVAPRTGGHLKLDNTRKGMIIKGTPLWKGEVKPGEVVTFALTVREQDANDTADADLKEAAEIATKVDHAKSLSELAHLPVRETLQGEHGENDHIGTILVRVKNVEGEVTIDTEPGPNVRYLKGFASNHPSARAFRLNGDHSDYELHLKINK